MGRRKECVEAVAARRQRGRMRALLRWHAGDPLHRRRVEDINHPRIADRDVKLLALGVEENDIRDPAERVLTRDLP